MKKYNFLVTILKLLFFSKKTLWYQIMKMYDFNRSFCRAMEGRKMI